MIAWLSEWLRDIVAVILLAVLVEMLLPNKTMQKYTRLVVGLFILLTLLSPVLRLLQTDMIAQLDAGMVLWDDRVMADKVKMPTLEEIQLKADQMKDQRDQEAVNLMEASLEEAMMAKLNESFQQKVHDVNVILAWEETKDKHKVPTIQSVEVSLLPPEEVVQDDSETSIEEIVAVEPVKVSVQIAEDSLEKSAITYSSNYEEGYIAVSDQNAKDIVNILMAGWGVNPELIHVKQQG